MPSFDAELKARMAAKAVPGEGKPPLLIVVTPGPKNARTDPDSGLRFYTWKGRELPSATTIRRMAGVPHRLVAWQVSQVVKRATEHFPELQAMLTRERKPRERVLEKNRIKEAQTWLRAAATEERDLAGKLGTEVHDAAALQLDPDTVEPALRPRLLQFRDWLEKSGCEILATEKQVFNLTVGYAGTLDFLARFAGGSVWLVDLKTGKGTYTEHLIQVLLYLMAEFVGEDDVIDQETTELLHSVAGIAILHLADDHWEFQRLRATPEDWRAARGLLDFAMWSYEHPDIGDVMLATRRGSANGS